jgi:hypothetical protein
LKEGCIKEVRKVGKKDGAQETDKERRKEGRAEERKKEGWPHGNTKQKKKNVQFSRGRKRPFAVIHGHRFLQKSRQSSDVHRSDESCCSVLEWPRHWHPFHGNVLAKTGLKKSVHQI